MVPLLVLIQFFFGFFLTVQWQCNVKEVFPSLVRDVFHAMTSESLLSSLALSEQALWFDWWLEKPFLVLAFILSQIPLACCKWFTLKARNGNRNRNPHDVETNETCFYTGKICYTGNFISIDVWRPHRCVLNLNVEYNSNKLFWYNIQYVTKFKNKISINQFCF